MPLQDFITHTYLTILTLEFIWPTNLKERFIVLWSGKQEKSVYKLKFEITFQASQHKKNHEKLQVFFCLSRILLCIHPCRRQCNGLRIQYQALVMRPACRLVEVGRRDPPLPVSSCAFEHRLLIDHGQCWGL